MKCFRLILIGFAAIITISGCKRKQGVNFIAELSSCDSEIYIRNWQFSFPDSLTSYDLNEMQHSTGLKATDQGDNLKNQVEFDTMFNENVSSVNAAHTPFAKFPDTIAGSYLALDSVFHTTNLPISVYAAATIRSSCQQNVGIITSANNGIQLWVNGELALKKYSDSYINGYQYVLKTHLRKGDNFFLVKLSHYRDDWRFLLKLCSIQYAKKNSIGNDYSSICENYLLARNDSIKIQFHSRLIDTKHNFKVTVTKIDSSLVLQKNVNCSISTAVSIPMGGNADGVYCVTMYGDGERFHQFVFYGDRKAYYNRLVNEIQKSTKSDRASKTLQLLQERCNYLDTVNVPHDNQYERKVSSALYQLAMLFRNISKYRDIPKNEKGLFLHAQNSLGYGADSYMTYVPDDYNPKKPIPLVVMLPVQTGLRPFDISTYVANTNAVEHIQRLADQLHYAVLWSNFRMYDNYALTRMVPESVFEIIKKVRADYNIDTGRIYACGDCAGGEWALFMGKNYPGFFAAIAMEGPAIPTADPGDMPEKQLSNYDFFENGENYAKTPIYLIHSTNDKKCNIQNTRRLIDTLTRHRGNVTFKELHTLKGNDLFFMDLMPENTIVSDMYTFFKGKHLNIPDTIRFSTSQLKFNQSFWISLNRIMKQKASIEAILDRKKNTIHITSRNVLSFTINLSMLHGLIRDRLKIITNGQISYANGQSDSVSIYYIPGKTPATGVNADGPINDFFVKPFLIVENTGSTTADKVANDYIAKYVSDDWQRQFLNDCKVKKDVDVNDDDLNRYNLLLIGGKSKNNKIRQLLTKIPVTASNDRIIFRKRIYEGENLMVKTLSPTMTSSGKYVMLIEHTKGKVSLENLDKMFFSNWYDYEVLDKGKKIAAGYF